MIDITELSLSRYVYIQLSNNIVKTVSRYLRLNTIPIESRLKIYDHLGRYFVNVYRIY